jgi:2-oxoacid:acceptor oxidoreductase delta subunit (pyruvate/2-ketoisovalerate family)
MDLTEKAGSSLDNKTGGWRVQKPVTDLDVCIGCGLCAKLCPEACIAMSAQKNQINKLKPETDYDYCKGCGLCAKECPVKAIKMIKDY